MFFLSSKVNEEQVSIYLITKQCFQNLQTPSFLPYLIWYLFLSINFCHWGERHIHQQTHLNHSSLSYH